MSQAISGKHHPVGGGKIKGAGTLVVGIGQFAVYPYRSARIDIEFVLMDQRYCGVGVDGTGQNTGRGTPLEGNSLCPTLGIVGRKKVIIVVRVRVHTIFKLAATSVVSPNIRALCIEKDVVFAIEYSVLVAVDHLDGNGGKVVVKDRRIVGREHSPCVAVEGYIRAVDLWT